MVDAVGAEVAAADVGVVSRLATEEEWMKNSKVKDKKKS